MQLNVIFTQISRMKILKVFFWKSGIPKKKKLGKIICLIIHQQNWKGSWPSLLDLDDNSIFNTESAFFEISLYFINNPIATYIFYVFSLLYIWK